MKNVIKSRLYPTCHSGDIQAINARYSLCSVHWTPRYHAVLLEYLVSRTPRYQAVLLEYLVSRTPRYQAALQQYLVSRTPRYQAVLLEYLVCRTPRYQAAHHNHSLRQAGWVLNNSLWVIFRYNTNNKLKCQQLRYAKKLYYINEKEQNSNRTS